MSGYQILTPSAGSTDWTSFATQVQYQRTGLMELSINNYDTTDVPSIAAGGKVEVAGSLYYFASTEAITGTPSTSNLNYIMIVTSSSSIKAEYTTDAPTWVASKQGYYDSSTGAKRYIGGCDIDLGEKWIYMRPEYHTYTRLSGSLRPLKYDTVNIGIWNMDDDMSVEVSHSLTLNTNIRTIDVVIIDDNQTSIYDFNSYKSGSSEHGGRWRIATTGGAWRIFLDRFTNGMFDSTANDSTTLNRGYIMIGYED